MTRRLCARGEQGSALLEMALSAIVLFAIVFGLMEGCLMLYTYHFVSEAAREGTRFAIVRGSSCIDFPAPCPANQSSDIQTYIQNLNLPGIRPAAMTVTTIWPTTGTSCTPSVTPCNNPGNLVQVTVNYQFPLVVPFLRSTTVAMSSSSEMVISQ
jgi:Flp pilus assembly protein TadG